MEIFRSKMDAMTIEPAATEDEAAAITAVVGNYLGDAHTEQLEKLYVSSTWTVAARLTALGLPVSSATLRHPWRQ